MFITTLSDEAYLGFVGQYSSKEYAIPLFLEKECRFKVPKHLFGYLSVEPNFPKNHRLVLLYEPKYDRHFVPIRVSPDGQYCLITMDDNEYGNFTMNRVTGREADLLTVDPTITSYIALRKNTIRGYEVRAKVRGQCS